MIMRLFVLISVCVLIGCQHKEQPKSDKQSNLSSTLFSDDPSSNANPEQVSFQHLHLDIGVDFDKKRISGCASWKIQIQQGDSVVFDTKNIQIDKVTMGENGQKANFHFGKTHPIFGTPLIVTSLKERQNIHIFYHTTDSSDALQWLSPDQTAEKTMPFLFTQSQPILARTWVPCPDGPGIRFTYSATVKTPKNMLALMSATNPTQKNSDATYTFKMEHPIPAYLLALTVGDISFGSTGKRTGVYAEPSLLKKSLFEFSDLENMLIAAEELYGPYPWERYDMIILPPSFPFGGMENPKLTFATPTIIAGDKSLTSLVAHELAHSWSGNLVTNHTWDDIWLNEGFTTYFERRIMEKLYGKEYADMLSLIGEQDLHKSLKEFGYDSQESKLKQNIQDGNPEDVMTDVPYEKGCLLLRYLEEQVGRETWDAFLKQYFAQHAFKSMDTDHFLEYLKAHLTKQDTVLFYNVKDWIYNANMPQFVPSYSKQKFTNVDSYVKDLISTSKIDASKTKKWTTHEWLHAIRQLPSNLEVSRIKAIDQEFGFSKSGNCEILAAWLEYSLSTPYGKSKIPEIESFLKQYGRRKFLMPLYKGLINSGQIQEAKRIFALAKTGYHPIAVNSVEALLQK